MSFLFAPARTVRVHSPAMPALLDAPALEFQSLEGTEALGELFTYTVRLQTPDNPLLTAYATGNVPVKQLLGKEFGLRIELDGRGSGLAARTGAGVREINGLVTSARFVQHEHRRGIYEITLRPWLALATLTSDYRIFQNKTPLEIIEAVLADYSFPTERRTAHTYPQRVFQVQYGETDFAFITRLMQEFGIYYFFEHGDGAHRLVLLDDAGAHRRFASEAYHTISHYPRGHKIDEEYCDSFCSIESLATGQWTTDDFDFTRPRARLAQTSRMPRNTGHAAQELYQWPGDYSDPEDGRMLARTRMEAVGAPGSRGQGSGNLRSIVTGCTFTLANHPQDSTNRDYLVIATSLHLHENAHASGGEDAYVCRTAFEVQPAEAVFRSPQTQPKPRTAGPQTAIVAGPAGKEVWTDEYGRVKLSFHWNRYCTRDENASCWIQVASPWAGSQFGGMHVPRIGQEVVVDFENGDPDRPIVTGRVYNQLNMPPRSLPGQANLSGFRSSELGTGGGASVRGNHMTLDDHPGKLQAQLKSDHLSSSLSLGHIGRIEDTTGRKDDRGQGAELRTDGHGAVRAARGLLLSTEARPDARAHMTDIGETSARLAQARDLHEDLGALAREAQTQEPGEQDAVAQVLQKDNGAIRGRSGGGNAGAFPEFAEPHLVIASPCGIHSTAAGSTHVASTAHTALTSGGHTSIAAGKGLLASVKEAVRVFAYKAIRLTAATAGIDIVALEQWIRLAARLEIKLEAGRISITAKDEVLVNGAGSYSRWNASGIVHGTPGVWRVHAATHAMSGPKGLDAHYPMPPVAPLVTERQHLLEEHFVLVEHAGGLRLPRQKYRVVFDGGRVVEGETNEQGETEVVRSMVHQIATVELLRHAEEGVLARHASFVRTPAEEVYEGPGVAAQKNEKKRPAGGKVHEANADKATSENKAPVHTSCDPHNWGLRMSVPKAGDAKLWEYPVAADFVEEIKKGLMGVQWGEIEAKWPLKDAEVELLSEIFGASIESVLSKTAFGLPKEVMPTILIPKDEEAMKLGINPEDPDLRGVMRGNDWLLVIAKGGILPIIGAAQRGEDTSVSVRELASTLYHEARHAQQYFWLAAMVQQFPSDYAHLPTLQKFWKDVFAAGVMQRATATPVPDEPSARVGLHRMAIGMYYQLLTSIDQANHRETKRRSTMAPERRRELEREKPLYLAQALPTELPLARKAAYDLLQDVGLGGLSIDVDAMAQDSDGSAGYRTRPWEEDSFACEEVVKQLWRGDVGGLLPEPGFCTNALRYALRARADGGVPGKAGHAQ